MFHGACILLHNKGKSKSSFKSKILGCLTAQEEQAVLTLHRFITFGLQMEVFCIHLSLGPLAAHEFHLVVSTGSMGR